MRDRVIWVVVAMVLAAMGISLWSDAPVAAVGACAAAAYSLVSAIRGHCLGGTCIPPAAGEGDTQKNQEADRE